MYSHLVGPGAGRTPCPSVHAEDEAAGREHGILAIVSSGLSGMFQAPRYRVHYGGIQYEHHSERQQPGPDHVYAGEKQVEILVLLVRRAHGHGRRALGVGNAVGPDAGGEEEKGAEIQRADDDPGPPGCTHGTPSQWPAYNDISFHGDGDHEPCGKETADIGQEDDQLTPAAGMEYRKIDCF